MKILRVQNQKDFSKFVPAKMFSFKLGRFSND